MHRVVQGATFSPCASCRKILQKLYKGREGLKVSWWLHFPRGKAKGIEANKGLTALLPRSGLAEVCPTPLSWARRGGQCQANELRSTNGPVFWGRSTEFRCRDVSLSLVLPAEAWGASGELWGVSPAGWRGWKHGSTSQGQHHLLHMHLYTHHLPPVYTHGCSQTPLIATSPSPAALFPPPPSDLAAAPPGPTPRPWW